MSGRGWNSYRIIFSCSMGHYQIVALYEAPWVGSFHAQYLHHRYSPVLFRVRRSGQHVEPKACATLDNIITAVRPSFHTVLMSEWDLALAAEERGQILVHRPAETDNDR